MKKLNLMDLVDGRGVCIHEGLLYCNSVQYYKQLNPNNMMREKSRKVFKLKLDGISEKMREEASEIYRKDKTKSFYELLKELRLKAKLENKKMYDVVMYIYSSSKTWQAYSDIIKSIPLAPGKLIITGAKRKKLDKSSIIISSDINLQEKTKAYRVKNEIPLFEYMIERMRADQYSAFHFILLTEKDK